MYECDPFVYLKSFRFLAITTGNFFFSNNITAVHAVFNEFLKYEKQVTYVMNFV